MISVQLHRAPLSQPSLAHQACPWIRSTMFTFDLFTPEQPVRTVTLRGAVYY